MAFDPHTPHRNEPERERRGGHGTGRRRGRTERVRDIDDEEERDEAPKGSFADAVLGARRSREDEHPERVHRDLDGERGGHRSPEPQTDARPAGPERHVGSVADEVEEPVARDERRGEGDGPPRGARRADHQAQRTRPCHRRDQAVRPRVVREGEGSKRGASRGNLDPFDPGENQNGPDEIEHLRSGEEKAERQSRLEPLGRESEREVPDEHPSTLAAGARDVNGSCTGASCSS